MGGVKGAVRNQLNRPRIDWQIGHGYPPQRDGSDPAFRRDMEILFRAAYAGKPCPFHTPDADADRRRAKRDRERWAAKS